MSREELPNRLRDISNGMHGLANDAAYIIRELEEAKAERDEAAAEMHEEGDRREAAERDANRLNADRRRLIHERDELSEKLALSKGMRDGLRAALNDKNRIPRVIAAEELKIGQVAARTSESSAIGWRVLVVPEDGGGANFQKADTIVLLADAPDKDVSGSTPTCEESGENLPGLTVEDLDAAPVGSKISFSGSWLEKDDDGTWMGVKAQDVISMSGYRALTYPEKPEPVTAETIRQSEPGSTWEDSVGDPWEWDGRVFRCLAPDGTPEGVSPEEALAGGDAPFTRSSVPPRGDYSKPELPTEPGSVILVTEWKGDKLDQPLFAVLGCFMWHSSSGLVFPDDSGSAEPDEITGFKPARIVVEDGEA